jgi:hypothetical protein
MPSSGKKLSPLDQLKRAANLVAIKKEVTLSDGSIFEFWATPLTFAERESALKGSGDDTNAFAMKLFVAKATDENGKRLFSAGHIPELKNEVKASDLDLLMKALIDIAEKEGEGIDPKG